MFNFTSLSSIRRSTVRISIVSAGVLLTAASALARPHYTSLDGLYFDYRSSSSSSFVTASDTLTLESLTTVHVAPQSGVTRPAHGTSSVADFTFDTTLFVTRSSGSPPLQISGALCVSSVVLSSSPGLPPGEPVIDLELLSLSLSSDDGDGDGVPDLMLRESPTRASTGLHRLDPVATDLYRVDSFFDIWTELSVDGGATWTECVSPMRMVSVPTPASVALAGLGMTCCIGRRRRENA